MVPSAQSFLLTVYEPGSAVLEDLRTGHHVHVADLAELGSLVASRLAITAPEQPPPTPSASQKRHSPRAGTATGR